MDPSPSPAAELGAAPSPASPPSDLRGRISRVLDPPRIVGLDVARGLAVLGMVGAHVGAVPVFEVGDPGTWAGIVHGNSALLFALLAGVSIALMTGRTALPDPADLPRLRLGLLGRGAFVFTVGIALEMLGVGLAVILTVYGLLYAAAVPVLRWRPRSLLLLAAVIALVGPVTVALLDVLTLLSWHAGTDLLVEGVYRVTTWVPLLLTGLALGRMSLDRARVAATAAGIGAALLLVGGGTGLLTAWIGIGEAPPGDGVYDGDGWFAVAGSDSLDEEELDAIASGMEDAPDLVPFERIDGDGLICWPQAPGDPTVYCEPEEWLPEDGTEEDLWGDEKGTGYYSAWENYPEDVLDSDPGWILADAVFSPAAHSGSTLELVRSGGLALLVTGLSCLITRRIRRPFLPLAAIGAMPLTAYTLHALTILVVVGPGGSLGSTTAWVVLATGLAVLCTTWQLTLGRGPLERLAASAGRSFSAGA